MDIKDVKLILINLVSKSFEKSLQIHVHKATRRAELCCNAITKINTTFYRMPWLLSAIAHLLVGHYGEVGAMELNEMENKVPARRTMAMQIWTQKCKVETSTLMKVRITTMTTHRINS